MKTYSIDFRERALAALDRGHTLDEVAGLLGVGTATLKRWRRRRRETGSLGPAPKPGRPPRIAPAQYPALLAQVGAAPDATLPEHCAAWERATGDRVSAPTMCRLLRRLGWPLKKNGWSPPSGTRRPGPPGRRRRPTSTPRPSSSSTRAGRIPR